MAAAPSSGRAHAVEPLEPASATDAAQALYERYWESVFRFCLRRLRSREEAEDALQTTFLYAFRALNKGVVPIAELSWLLKIAENACNSRWHDARRRSAHEVAEDPQALHAVAAPPGPARDELLAVEEALGGLTEAQRRAIVLREWQGLSYREIADELGISLGAAEVLTFRARRALADALGGVETGRRRIRGFDVGWLAGTFKSVFGGGIAAKAVVAAVAVAVGTSALAVAVPDRERRPREPASAGRAGATERERSLRQPAGPPRARSASVAPVRRGAAGARRRPAPVADAPAQEVSRSEGTAPEPSAGTDAAPASQPPVAGTGAAPKEPTGSSPPDGGRDTGGTVTDATSDAGGTVADAAGDAIGTATKPAESTVGTATQVVDATAEAAVETVEAAAQTATQTAAKTAETAAAAASSAVETVTTTAATVPTAPLPSPPTLP